MKRVLRRPLLWVLLVVVIGLLVWDVTRSGPSRTTLSLTQFERIVSAPGQVVSATVHDSSDTITGTLKDGTAFQVQYPDRYSPEITQKLLSTGAKVSVSHAKSNPWLSDLVDYYLPIALVFGLFLWVLSSVQGGGSRIMSFGKAKAKTAGKDRPKVTFSDVAGADEAVAELQEIKEFLESPARFHALGAKIPKGVLLFGPPGTGKTLLARAVAGEAGVPFFSISGSDFVEMFVGVGASRVRDLFQQAKASAPAIVFMDEIDAVGRHRGAGLGGGHDEREQTLNQLLVELDGFDARGGVILIAATNRPDILDPALLRPGRFDRQIVVDRPDITGRRAILDVHAKGKILGRSVDLDVLARRTPGFTGADLANLLNEAAILTARRSLRQIGMRECEEAIERVLAGPERKTLVMSDHDKLVTAYHEAGHAIVGHVLPDADPIHKVSIVARSRSLGLTYTLPEDRFNHSRSQLRDAMAMALGGRSAEELVFGEPTTGAENDIEKVTNIARAMVTEYGMSDALGPQQLGQREGEVFLGRDLAHHANYSEEVAACIDREVRALIEEAHRRALAVLGRHRATLDRMARELVEKESLDSLELAALLGPLKPWQAPEPTTSRDAPRRSRHGGRLTPPVAAAAPPANTASTNGGRRRPLVAAGRKGAAVVTASRSAAKKDLPVVSRSAAKKDLPVVSRSAAKKDLPPSASKKRGRLMLPATRAGRHDRQPGASARGSGRPAPTGSSPKASAGAARTPRARPKPSEP
jgi:cell division protease FtsH